MQYPLFDGTEEKVTWCLSPECCFGIYRFELAHAYLDLMFILNTDTHSD